MGAAEAIEQAVVDFYKFPPVGEDDWRYAFATAKVRALESAMLTRAALLDMANAQDFEAAIDLLSATEYALAQGNRNFAELETLLMQRRSEVRALFKNLIIDEPIVELFRSRDDFANLRLALRRTLAEKPIGTDYSNEGNVPAEFFEEVFEQENYRLLPEHMQEAVEEGVLAYYQNKDIRQIDYAVDTKQAEYNLKKAQQLESMFLCGLFRIQVDLTNIRIMLRLKFTESEQRNVFLDGGFIEPERFRHGLDIGYEAVAPLFFATAYYQIIEAGVSYIGFNKSFLKLEQHCDEYMRGYLRTTTQITAGPQPIIAYLLMKENEIRVVRMISTAKKNALDTRLILDRLGEQA